MGPAPQLGWGTMGAPNFISNEFGLFTDESCVKRKSILIMYFTTYQIDCGSKFLSKEITPITLDFLVESLKGYTSPKDMRRIP